MDRNPSPSPDNSAQSPHPPPALAQILAASGSKPAGTLSQSQVEIRSLPRADGSATFSHGGYMVIASVNGPMEAQRKDELPARAVLEVVVRPAAGTGGTRERQLEATLGACLRALIRLEDFPRCLIQVTLQVTETPQDDYVVARLVQAQQNIPVIPALLHAALLALLTAAVPLRALATAAVVAVLPSGEMVVGPSPRQVADAQSLHALAFTPRLDEVEAAEAAAGEDEVLILVESEGSFRRRTWVAAVDAAREICCRGESTVKGFIRAAMECTAA